MTVQMLETSETALPVVKPEDVRWTFGPGVHVRIARAAHDIKALIHATAIVVAQEREAAENPGATVTPREVSEADVVEAIARLKLVSPTSTDKH